jgi:hypothetical protein
MVFETRGTEHRVRAGAVVAVYALCLIGCGSGSSTAVGSGTAADGDAAVAVATFTEVYAEILQPVCSSCHRPGGVGLFQDFSSQSAAYAALVGVKASGPSCGSSGDTRVVPGNPSESLLVQKVSGATPPCGSPMPLGGPPLSSAQVTLIQDWIKGGASND